MFGRPIACNSCVHFVTGYTDGTMFCEAFPNGIPTEVRTGENDHTQPITGDGNIQWELHPNRVPQHEAYLKAREFYAGRKRG